MFSFAALINRVRRRMPPIPSQRPILILLPAPKLAYSASGGTYRAGSDLSAGMPLQARETLQEQTCRSEHRLCDFLGLGSFTGLNFAADQMNASGGRLCISGFSTGRDTGCYSAEPGDDATYYREAEQRLP